MNKITKLRIFDFDGTLVDTPLPEFGKPMWKEKTGEDYPHKGWWSKVESLSMEVFEHPTLPSVIKDYHKAKAEEGVLMVMLTGRRANSGNKPDLEGAVKAILDSHGLEFDMYLHNYGGETCANKQEQINKILAIHPDIKYVSMWDDRDEHIPRFQEFGDKLIKDGVITTFQITHVLGEHHGETP